MSSYFGGEHMSAAAVPPSIGSDCALANCIPGSQANSEASELSRFSQKTSVHIPPVSHAWLALRQAGGHSIWTK